MKIFSNLLIIIFIHIFSLNICYSQNERDSINMMLKGKIKICDIDVFGIDAHFSLKDSIYSRARHYLQEGAFFMKDGIYYQEAGSLNFDRYNLLKSCHEIKRIITAGECRRKFENIIYDGKTFPAGFSFNDNDKYQGTTSFKNATFQGSISFLSQNFSECDIDLTHSTLNQVSFNGDKLRRVILSAAVISDDFDFDSVGEIGQVISVSTKFNGETRFSNSIFKGKINLSGSSFNKGVEFTQSIFYDTLDLNRVLINGDLIFNGARFRSNLVLPRPTLNEDSILSFQFNGVKFWIAQNFSGYEFYNKVDFRLTQFDEVNFERSIFPDSANFQGAIFSQRPNFSGTIFKGYTFFDEKSFVKGVDLSNASFNKGATVFLETEELRGRDFRYRWEDISSGRLKFDFHDNPDKEKKFGRIEKIYRTFIDDFNTRGLLKHADHVKDELNRLRAEIIGSLTDRVIGWLFGYGGFPYTALVIVLVLLIFFTFIWRTDQYFPIVYKLLYAQADCWSVPKISRLIQSFVFSSSIFFGIRFKHNWIHWQKQSFVLFVVIEWSLGLLFLFAFILFVSKNVPLFEFVKNVVGL